MYRRLYRLFFNLENMTVSGSDRMTFRDPHLYTLHTFRRFDDLETGPPWNPGTEPNSKKTTPPPPPERRRPLAAAPHL